MSAGTPPRAVPRDGDQPLPGGDLLVLLVMREIGRAYLPVADPVYSFPVRTSG